MLPDALPLPTARKLLVEIIESGRVTFTAHALEQMAARSISEAEVVAVLRSGAVRSCDLIAGSWRYRVEGRGVVSVVAFRSDTWTVVVTAWRG
ncbi:DUF4258 domain-containing protein [Myxococcota bacterium]|nr:DUF4258 domain-containing protein [Myxococcota bacterium]